MTKFGLDYEGGLSSTEVKDAGASFVCRYLSSYTPKNLTKNELAEMKHAGVDVVTVWEAEANSALGGSVAGIRDAQAALKLAEALDGPGRAPIYFAVDFDETPAEAAAVKAYFEGVSSLLGKERTGAYGGYWTIKRLFDAGVIGFGWQTYAWSNGMWDSRAHIQQYSNNHTVSGVGVDFDRTTVANFGQWFYEPPVRPAPPKPKNASGKAVIELSCDFDTPPGHVWAIEKKPGTFKAGTENRKWAVLIEIDEKTGEWTHTSRPANATSEIEVQDELNGDEASAS